MPARRALTRPAARLAGAALLIAAVVAVFGGAASFGFVDYDDGDYVFRNPNLTGGSPGERVRWALTGFHAANWHPVTWLSLIADAALFGLDPGAMHAENVALHAANALLLGAYLARATGAFLPSLLAALLFAVHPLRVESVAWVTERKGLLMALFALLALHAHLAHARRPTAFRAALVTLLGAAAMAAKPQAVALPALLVLLAWWPLGRIGARPGAAAWGRLVLAQAPLLAAAAATTALTVAAQRAGGAVPGLERLPLADRVSAAAVAPFVYLAQSAAPAGLAPVYPLATPPAGQAAGAIALLAALTALAWRRRAAGPALLAGWLGFLVLLAPVSNLFQVGQQAGADRYTYLPHLPLLLAGAWGARRALAGRPRAGAAAVAAALAAALALGSLARGQVAVWRDDLELFSHAVSVTAGNWKMHYNLGNTLERLGREDEARRQYELAIAANPAYAEPLNNLGALHGRRGDAAAAEALFLQAVAVNPRYAPGWFNLGRQREAAGRAAEAAAAYARAAALQRAAPRGGAR